MRIKQQAQYLKSLVSAATKGELVPAAFQRPYVWSQADVLALLQSILKGYPIGSLLLWTPYGKADIGTAGRRRLGPVRPADTAKPESLLLDGQNRLASLAWVTYGLDAGLPDDLTDNEKAVWCSGECLVVDIETQTFAFVPREEADSGFRLPARALLDSLYANPLLRQRWSDQWQSLEESRVNAALKWFDQAQSAFSSAQTVVTSLEYATAEEAKDAFLHICKVGVPMSEADFEAAIAWEVRSQP
jgi:hypothetical protein